MSYRDEPIEVEYIREIHDTGNAVLFDIEGEEIWIPSKLLIAHDSDNTMITIPLWLAEEKGLG